MGTRQLSIWAHRVEGKPTPPMTVVDPGIGIASTCVARGFALPAHTEFDLVVSVTCKSIKSKNALEKYLERSFYKERERNPAVKFEEYLQDAAELELVTE
jgi:hypothetical protein